MRESPIIFISLFLIIYGFVKFNTSLDHKYIYFIFIYFIVFFLYNLTLQRKSFREKLQEYKNNKIHFEYIPLFLSILTLLLSVAILIFKPYIGSNFPSDLLIFPMLAFSLSHYCLFVWMLTIRKNNNPEKPKLTIHETSHEKRKKKNTKRIYAWYIDLVIVGIFAVLLEILFILALINSTEKLDFINIILRQLILTYSSWSLLIIRDVIGKKSLGKRILKLKIVNKNDGKEAVLIKRLVRNLTWLLGPVEIIVFLIVKERIGDKIAGTDVIAMECGGE